MLLLATLADLKNDRIPNGFVILGIVIGILCSLWYGSGIRYTVISMFLAFLLLYPMFKIGALGAGDVKIFMMIGSFVGVKELFMVMIMSFVIGALCSLIKLLLEHNGRERLYYFLSYISEVVRTRQWKIYGEQGPSKKKGFLRRFLRSIWLRMLFVCCKSYICCTIGSSPTMSTYAIKKIALNTGQSPTLN